MKQWSDDGTGERFWRALLSRMVEEGNRAFLDGQKGETGLEKPRWTRETEVMMISDRKGVPIGLFLDSAQHYEICLTEATLKMVRVLQKWGRTRTRHKELVADKAYDNRSIRSVATAAATGR